MQIKRRMPPCERRTGLNRICAGTKVFCLIASPVVYWYLGDDLLGCANKDARTVHMGWIPTSVVVDVVLIIIHMIKVFMSNRANEHYVQNDHWQRPSTEPAPEAVQTPSNIPTCMLGIQPASVDVDKSRHIHPAEHL